MNRKKTLQDFYEALYNANLLKEYGEYFFDEDQIKTLDMPAITYLGEPGDIEEWLRMEREEFIAYMGLLQSMNFLWSKSSLKAGTDEDWIGRPHHWYGLNQYWIKNYPKAYRYLEVVVWG